MSRHSAGAPAPERRWLTILVLGVVALTGLGAGYLIGQADDGPLRASTQGVAAKVQTTRPPGAAGQTTTPRTTAAPTVPPSTTTAPATTTTAGRLGSGQPITIAFAGDINFEGVLRNRLDADPSTAVGPFSDVLRGADLAVGNLETAIAEGGTRVDKQFTFRAPPRAVDALRAAGFDTVSAANNHGLDFGPDGLLETLAAKRAQPDRFIIGVGGEEDEAFKPFTTVVKGQRVSVIAATQVIDGSQIQAWTATSTHAGLASAKRVDRLVEEVRAARTNSDTVVVFLHWGIEQSTCPSGDQQTLAKALVEAGADVIVGGHAHRVQGGGRMGDAVVHYGLGNFLFKANSAEGSRTGVFEVTVTGRRVDAYRWIPGRIAGSVPQPLAGGDAAAALAHWQGLQGCAGLAP